MTRQQIVLRSFEELAAHFGIAPAGTDEVAEYPAAGETLNPASPASPAPPVTGGVASAGFVLPDAGDIADAIGNAGASLVPAMVSADGPPLDAMVAPASTPAEDLSGHPLDGEIDIAALLADLERASEALATATRRDREIRALALRDLERYDVAVAAQREAEQVRGRAVQMRRDAEALLESAYGEEARAEAERVLALAARVEAAAVQLAGGRRQEAERLVERVDLQKALAERRRAQEEEDARAAEAERARRLSQALVEARAALDAGQFEEAEALLGPLAKEHPDNAQIASLMTMMARLALSVKVNAAEDALWAARREFRHDPAAAVGCLEELDVDGLPEPLARQVFGEWARACRRRCQRDGIADALRYAPRVGRGAVLGRLSPDGPYVVLSALGMAGECRPGNVASQRQVRWARPLAGE